MGWKRTKRLGVRKVIRISAEVKVVVVVGHTGGRRCDARKKKKKKTMMTYVVAWMCHARSGARVCSWGAVA